MTRTRWLRGFLLAFVLTAALLVGATSGARADTTIGAAPDQFYLAGDQFGPPGGARPNTVGQTVTVPATDTVLQSFSFQLEQPTTLLFRGVVAAWDSTTRSSGPALWESESTHTTNPATYETVTFTTGGVSLTAGQKYVLFVTTLKDPGQPIPVNYGTYHLTDSDGAYAGGTNVWSWATTFEGLSASSGWNPLPAQKYDMAFSATFTAPAADHALTPTNGDALSAYADLAMTDATLGSFTDSNSAAVASDFSAEVCWNDSGPAPSDCVAATVADASGNFVVSGSHTFTDTGSYTATTTITHTASQTQTTLSTAVTVANPFTGSTDGTALTGSPGVALASAPLGSFTYADTSAAASDFTAEVCWDVATLKTLAFGPVLLGSVTCSAGVVSGSSGSFSVTGDHTYSVGGSYNVVSTVSDGNGNQATTQTSITISADTTAPTVTLGQVNGSDVTFPYATNGTVASIGGTCSLPDGPVTVTLDGTPTSANADCGGTGTWTLALDNTITDEGTYTFAASQTDPSSNTGGSGDETVTVDLTGPVVSLSKLNGTSVTFPYTTSSPVGSVGGSCESDGGAISVTVDGAVVSSSTTCSTAGTWTLELAAPLSTPDTYMLGASQSDTAGNTSTIGVSLTIETAPTDTTPPTTTIVLNPASPDGLNGWYTESVGVTVSSDDTDVAQTRCWLDPETAPTSFDDLPDETCSVTTVGDDGEHVLYAGSKDTSDNKEALVSASIKIDTTVPTVSFSGVAFSADTGTSSSDFVTKTAAQTITATLSGAPVTGELVYGSLNGGADWSDISSNLSTVNDVVSLSWDVTLNGSGTLKLKVADAAGNDGPVFSQAYVLDEGVPAVSLTKVNGVTVDFQLPYQTSSPINSLGGTCSPGDGTVSVTASGGAPGLVAALAPETTSCSSAGEWALTLASSLTAPDNYLAMVSQTDAAGNTGSESHTLTITAAPPTDVLTPTDGAPLTATEGVPLRNAILGTFTDSNTAATAASFTTDVCWNDGTSCTAGTVSGARGNFTVRGTHTFAIGGSYDVVTTVTDAHGTEATIRTTVTVGQAPLKAGTVRVTLDKAKTTATVLTNFTDANPNGTADDYSASISWGDSSTPSTGVVAAVRSGLWSVSGGPHTYTSGTYTITITVTHGASTLPMTATVRTR